MVHIYREFGETPMSDKCPVALFHNVESHQRSTKPSVSSNRPAWKGGACWADSPQPKTTSRTNRRCYCSAHIELVAAKRPSAWST